MRIESRIFNSLDDAAGTFGPCALSIGNFDGVHAGHRRIFRRVREVARERGWKSSVLTFHPHPAKVVAPERAPRLLTTIEQRCSLMAAEGIEQVLVLPFGPEVARLSPEEFVEKILVQALGTRAVLVGSNFRFGHAQAGDTAVLKEAGRKHGLRAEVIPAISLRGRSVSSSEIRRLIEAGSVYTASRLLQRPHALEGRVVRGLGIGSVQTVPTLNLSTEAEVLPADGVYVTRTCDLDQNRAWPSITNIGYRPTFDGRERSIETFLLAALDGPPKRIRLEFLRRLREERKFPGPKELKTQILRDSGRAKRYFQLLERRVSPDILDENPMIRSLR